MIGLVLIQHGKGADMGASLRQRRRRAACSAPPAAPTSCRARRRSARPCSSSARWRWPSWPTTVSGRPRRAAAACSTARRRRPARRPTARSRRRRRPSRRRRCAGAARRRARVRACRRDPEAVTARHAAPTRPARASIRRKRLSLRLESDVVRRAAPHAGRRAGSSVAACRSDTRRRGEIGRHAILRG